jgi:hypothetical protein
MTYQATLQSLKKSIDNSKSLLGNSGDYQKFKGLDFYHWDKSKDKQQDTFVGLVGLPRKNGVEHGFYDYEKDIIDYLERYVPSDPKNRHLAILKSSGLGITTLLLYYIGWKATTNNAWTGKRVHILTAPRIELTIDLITRLKNIFARNNLLQFDDKNTVCTINSCTIQGFPSHLGIRSMRGYTDIACIVIDEASWFNINQNMEITDTVERFKAKTDPIIVACSTPQKIGDWLYEIKQQPEEERFYHLMELSYKVGLGKIYSEQEIELQKKSLSFEKEYNLNFNTSLDAIFNTQDIDAVVNDPYVIEDVPTTSTTHWIGIDPGFSTSKFGIVCIRWRDNKIEVVYESETEHADLEAVREQIHSLIQHWRACRVFIDSSSISLIRTLCKDYGEPDCTLYPDETKDKLLMTTSCRQPMIHSVNFRTKHKIMLELLHKVVSTRQIRILPQFRSVITALRTATNKPNADIWDLDKSLTSSNDVLDALRLSLLCLRSTN